ncbi:hypothetical protein [Actinomadura xylanilytica]|uniref:hypothetical protein n=1 Tax=Actinomadura xylanilytica TaxID=887459 RepID=UPI00255A79FB|nr:hypothetical protein [Actinomadura xylanilytica]MDL4776264.1 hypothetical protein [Actinomadura xylanilytica]
MSGPRETRESAEEAGTASVPAPAAPPSFGSAGPPAGETGTPAPADAASIDTAPAATGTAEEAQPTVSGALRLPPFGLQTPWWAADSGTDTAPPTDLPPPPPADPEPEVRPEPALELPPDPHPDLGPEPGSGPVQPHVQPPGTLVAGLGAPNVDSRGAVPAKPIVHRPGPKIADTDPDGIPVTVAPVPQQRPPAAPKPETAAKPVLAKPAPADPAPAKAVPAQVTPVQVTPVQVTPAQVNPAQVTPVQTAQTAPAKAASTGRAKSSTASGPVLIPDAILPPGVSPPADGSAPIATEATAPPQTGQAGDAGEATVVTPTYHSEGGIPLDDSSPASTTAGQGVFTGTGTGTGTPAGPAKGGSKSGGDGWRKPGVIGGGAVAIVAAAVAVFLIAGSGSGDPAPSKDAAGSAPAQSSAPAPAPTLPPPPAKPVDIGNEQTDTKPLALAEAYPTGTIDLGGRTYVRDRSSVNHRCSLAARGEMAQALIREGCRSVVRVTFLGKKKALAVTSGIVSMPDRAAALKVNRAGDPGKYEWFRGMAGQNSQKIDQAGGYASSTVRGRYIAYAYATYADGKRPAPGDTLLKDIAQQFLDYSLRPIEARARG